LLVRKLRPLGRSEFTYTNLLQKKLDNEMLHTLELLQEYRDKIKNDDYFDIEFEPFLKHFEIVKSRVIFKSN